MKLLLHADVPKLGFFGDVVEVSEGYARNYLLPQLMAVKPTEANIKAIEMERAQKAEKRRLAREALLKVADKVNETEVSIAVTANEQGHLYGSVTETEVAKALQDAGHEVKTKQVVMTEHFRSLGSYNVDLKFSDNVKATIKVWVVRPEGQEGESEPAEQEISEQD